MEAGKREGKKGGREGRREKEKKSFGLQGATEIDNTTSLVWS